MEGTVPPFRHRLRRRHLPPREGEILCPPRGGPPEQSEGEDGELRWREPFPPSVTGSAGATFPPGKEKFYVLLGEDRLSKAKARTESFVGGNLSPLPSPAPPAPPSKLISNRLEAPGHGDGLQIEEALAGHDLANEVRKIQEKQVAIVRR